MVDPEQTGRMVAGFEAQAGCIVGLAFQLEAKKVPQSIGIQLHLESCRVLDPGFDHPCTFNITLKLISILIC